MIEYKNTGGIQVGTFVTIDDPDEKDYRVWRVYLIEPWYLECKGDPNYKGMWKIHAEIMHGDENERRYYRDNIKGAHSLNYEGLMEGYHSENIIKIVSVEKMIKDGKFNKKELKDIYIRYLEETLDKNGIEFERR